MLQDFAVAYPRIQALADGGTFKVFPDEKVCGALTGFCEINGRAAAVFAQEPTRFAGAMASKLSFSHSATTGDQFPSHSHVQDDWRGKESLESPSCPAPVSRRVTARA